MSIWQLSIRNLLSRPWTTALSLLLIAFGIGIISLLIQLDSQLSDKMEKNVAGIDLVAGAKGSPMQLILSSVYHIDYPTGNIPLADAEALSRHPAVAMAVPLALGDNYRSYRIVGTNSEYLEFYPAEIADGKQWSKDYEVTIGAEVARSTGMKVGSYFHGAHGMEEHGHSHDHVDYKVVGVFEPTGTVIDQLILTSVESVWGVHSDSENENASEEVTALLLKVKRPIDLLNLPNFINRNTNLQAASPAMQLSRLFSLMSSAYDLVRYLALGIMLISGLSVFIALYNALRQRKYEIALLRTMGGTRVQVFLLVMLEGLLVSIIGYLLGILLSRACMGLVSGLINAEYNYRLDGALFHTAEFWLLAAALGIGFVSSLIPAMMAYRADIADILTEND